MFKLFKRNKAKSGLTESQLKWNKMWELWTEGKIESPFEEMMTYQGEVNNGGHSQYFSNTEDVQKCISVLYGVLSPKLKINLENAYDAYMRLEQDETDEEAENILEECDNVYYDNEQDIITVLEEYSEKNIELD